MVFKFIPSSDGHLLLNKFSNYEPRKQRLGRKHKKGSKLEQDKQGEFKENFHGGLSI